MSDEAYAEVGTTPKTDSDQLQAFYFFLFSEDKHNFATMGALAPCRWQHTESRFSLSYACVTF
jgi:hypothetical protein